ncbi:MAG: hypothetical protein PHW56_11350, partial [Methanosarcinaceae archaeon]|nr:hypothetical protein [Methanosarcinaceae archaeon]
MSPAEALDNWKTGSILGATTEIKNDHIKSFDLNAPEGLGLSGFIASDFSPNSNTSFRFDQYGKTYYLDVNSSKNIGWWTFDITLTYSNGTTEYIQLESLQPFATDYDLHFQYYPGNLEFDFIDVDVYTGILPLKASFEAQSSAGLNYSHLLPADMVYNANAFSNIAGYSSSFFDLKLYACTPKDFKDQNKSPFNIPDDPLEKIFSWTWDKIISFVGVIPFIGPYLASVLEIAALSIDAIIFYFSLLFLEYSETTFLTIEFFILSYSFTGFK